MKNPAGNAIPFSSKRRQLDVGGFSDEAEVSFTLPSTWYYDPDVYAREHEAIFYKTWWYQCHSTDVAQPGDYYAGQVADQGIFIIRDSGGELHAFYNVRERNRS